MHAAGPWPFVPNDRGDAPELKSAAANSCTMRVEPLTTLMELNSAKESDLLARFVDERDSEAFAELLRRHGPMVLSACRRILGNREDAEDAFQATFFVLAMRAARIRRPEVLASWLFGVARRTAIRARSIRHRREKLERSLSEMTHMKAAGGSASDELSSLLDAEIARLSPKYRNPVVLCYLEGRTNAQTAKQLALPLGTVATRLRRAREILRDRLVARGVTLSGQTLDETLRANQASEAVPLALSTLTAKAASTMSSGKPTAVARGTVPHRALALANGVVRSMLTARVVLVGAMFLGLSLSMGMVSQAVRTRWTASSRASNLISVKVADTQGRAVAGASICVVTDGHEETFISDDQGQCMIRLPPSTVALCAVFYTKSGYLPFMQVWPRKARSLAHIPVAVSVSMRRGVVPERILVTYGRWVHTINPPVLAPGKETKTYEMSLDANGRIMRRTAGNEPLRAFLIESGVIHYF